MADYTVHVTAPKSDGGGIDITAIQAMVSDLANAIANADVIDVQLTSDDPDIQSQIHSIVDSLQDPNQAHTRSDGTVLLAARQGDVPSLCEFRTGFVVAYVGHCAPRIDPELPPRELDWFQRPHGEDIIGDGGTPVDA